MAHLIEPSPSARAKCRGCGERIASGQLRFGENLPNPFAEGQLMTHWYHLECAACRRPEPLLAALGERELPLDGQADLERTARQGLECERLTRLNGAERASSGRAQCRHCRTTIDKDAWRLPLVYYENERFAPAGFVHAACAAGYCDATDVAEILARVRRFAPALSEQELAELQAAMAAALPPAAPLPPGAGG